MGIADQIYVNLQSNPQLQEFLFEFLKLKPVREASLKTGNYSTDEAVLTHYAEVENVEFCKLLMSYRKLEKARSTYLEGIRRFIEKGNYIVHPDLWLNIAETYRSCIAKGTLIDVVRDVSKYPKGIPIEKIKVGDYAYCYDDDLNPQLKIVKWVGKTGYKKIIRIHWKASHGKVGYLDCTPEHLIRLSSGKYVQAKNLLKKDQRESWQSKHRPKVSVLSLNRVYDELFFTGITTKYNRGLKEHRFIYSQLIGELKDTEIIHHLDGNHLNHTPINISKTNLIEHGKFHKTLSKPINRLKNKLAVKKGWRDGRYKNAVHYGKDNSSYLGLTKSDCIKELIRIKGQTSKSRYDFNTFKKYLKQFGIDKNFIKSIKRGEVPNNHVITEIEELNIYSDVYDIEVEDCHNFIAGGICVHNSSTDPNFQNQPKHGEIIPGIDWSIVRGMYIPPPIKGFLLGEVDYEGAEVKSAAMESQDSQLIEDLNNDMDMHSHWAKPMFGLQDLDYNQIKKDHKEERFMTKNDFTFATMFGASNTSIAENMRKHEFFRKYVYEKFYRGMAKPVDWDVFYVEFSEKLIKDSQDQFFERYKQLRAFYDSIIKLYYEQGFVENLFGFRRNYPLKRNEIINFRIQSTSFLLLLDSIIQIEEYLEKNPMRSHPISQIHDSMESNICIYEAAEYMEMVDSFMIHKPHLPFTDKIKLSTEWEMGHSWNSMKVIKDYKNA